MARGENTLSVRRPQPHTTDPWKEEKEKRVEDKTNEQIRPKKSLALLLKPVSRTQSIIGSVRPFRSIEIL